MRKLHNFTFAILLKNKDEIPWDPSLFKYFGIMQYRHLSGRL